MVHNWQFFLHSCNFVFCNLYFCQLQVTCFSFSPYSHRIIIIIVILIPSSLLYDQKVHWFIVVIIMCSLAKATASTHLIFIPNFARPCLLDTVCFTLDRYFILHIYSNYCNQQFFFYYCFGKVKFGCPHHFFSFNFNFYHMNQCETKICKKWIFKK